MGLENPYEKFTDGGPTVGDLQILSSLVMELFMSELALEKAEEDLRAAQEKVRSIGEQQIPELMAQAGVSEFSTSSGIKIKIKPITRASIPKARRAEAYEWMDERGHGHLIKHNLKVGFGRDEEKAATALLAQLKEGGFLVKDELKVEPTTLKKMVVDLLEDGEDVPMDLFGVHQFSQTKITQRPEEIF